MENFNKTSQLFHAGFELLTFLTMKVKEGYVFTESEQEYIDLVLSDKNTVQIDSHKFQFEIAESFWKRIQDEISNHIQYGLSESIVADRLHAAILWLLRRLYNISEITSEIKEKYDFLYTRIYNLINNEYGKYTTTQA